MSIQQGSYLISIKRPLASSYCHDMSKREGNLVDVQIQKMELRPAMRPEVKAALERAAARLAPDLEYLKDK